MKKFLLLFLFSGFLVTSYQAYSQCNGGSGNCAPTVVSSVATKIESSGTNCITTLNININIQHNNGYKNFVVYFYNNAVPANVCNGNLPSAHPDLLGYIVLERNSGVFSILNTSYNLLTPITDYSISSTPISGGSNINITGLRLTKPGSCTTSTIAMFTGGSNASSTPLQCYNSGSFVAYQLFVSGKVDCTSPRNYDLFIDTDFRSGSSSAPISGSYEVYIDTNNDGLVDGTDVPITPSTGFNTAVLTPTLNRFTTFDNVYGTSTLGDLNTSRNLVVKVVPSTPGVASLVGRLANGCGTLPVSMKSFDAKKQMGKISLTWETADESNNKGFDVQRRLNNGQYQTVAFVPAKAINGGGASYSYDDQSLLPDGSIYYRLRQVDNDEQSRYSDIRLIHNNTKKLNVTVYPNPSKGAATLILPEAAGSMDITIEDYTGRTIQRWTSYNSNNLQINQLRPGIYMIRVQSKESGEQTVHRLMVQ